MKVGIVGHGFVGTTFITPKPVSVSIIDGSDRNIEVVGGNVLKSSTYNLTAQLPLTRQERRKQQRKTKNK